MQTNISTTAKRTTIRTLNKIISVLFAVLFSLFIFLPVFAEETTAEEKTIMVTLVCKVDDTIETDDYSPVVVKLVNEDTRKTYEYPLYKYNQFSEKYLMPVGVYSILYARIDNRNDLILEVESEESFEIGIYKTIYFELHDTKMLPTTKTDDENSTGTTTHSSTLHTLYPVDNTTSGKETNTDISGMLSTVPGSSDITTEQGEGLTTVPSNTNTSDEYTSIHYRESSTESTTKQLTIPEEKNNKVFIMFVALAVSVILMILIIAVLYLIKRKR